MADNIQFESFRRQHNPHCLACEEMLTDAQDGTLTPVDQAWFDGHLAGCATCSQMFADATRGAAWLEMLKAPRPEPSAALLERILAQTDLRETGFAALQSSPVGGVLPTGIPPTGPAVLPAAFAASQAANVLAFRPRVPRLVQTFLEPRLAMTAAMAFFSIALTLNLSGVRLDQLHASSLKPANLQRTYYQANASAVRYYDNLRVVHVLESRVEDLREANGPDDVRDRARFGDRNSTPPPVEPRQAAPVQPDARKPEQHPKQTPDGQGTSRRESPLSHPHTLSVGETLRSARPEQVQQGGLA